jgi:hypothetical protein
MLPREIGGVNFQNMSKPKLAELSAELIRETFDYDPITGIVRWRKKRRRVNPGDRAGYVDEVSQKSPVRIVRFMNKNIDERYIAWIHCYGGYDGTVIHRSEDKTDNRISNLYKPTNSNGDIDFEYVDSVLSYNPATGIFTWKEGNKITPSGSSAGYVHKFKCGAYVVIKLKGKQYKAHRLAWLLYHGEWPKDKIDHRDGDGTNNRIDNLRNADFIINARNMKLMKSNTSGISGVTAKGNKWVARINTGGRSARVHLGNFDSLFEAACARKSAEIKYGYSSRHGR